MKKHKWWHFFFTQSFSRQEKSTSYCGTYLWYEYEIDGKECCICNLFSARIKDHGAGKLHVLNLVEFVELKNKVDEIKNKNIDGPLR